MRGGRGIRLRQRVHGPRQFGALRGAELADPASLLEGTGKYMRHVKLRPQSDVDASALIELVDAAYTDMKGRLDAERTRARP